MYTKLCCTLDLRRNCIVPRPCIIFVCICSRVRDLRIPDGKSPRFPKKPTIRQDGDILIMECILEAHPVPDITWYQGEKTCVDSPRIKMSRKATSKDTYVLTLEINDPKIDDGGNYRCNAFNAYGESNANIALNFQGNAANIQSVANLGC